MLPGVLRAKAEAAPAGQRPNVILCMADDLGWGDTGYNGHPYLKTPTLDEMARTAMRFNRFYSGAPVCSPTRGSCITGRHPYRYGVFFANIGHMRKQEVTIAEVLKEVGYVTGHFGKWHLGTLTKTVIDSNRGGPRGVAHYSPPWENGFDVCFSTEAKVPTYNPMKTPGTDEPYGTHYWSGPEQMVTKNLDGDDSRIIMDRVEPFIRRAVADGKPFLAVVWFHAPHLPVLAGPQYRKLYADRPTGAQNYLGCITAMDAQIGRMRKLLRELGVAENTMLWFCSDNGPEGRRHTPDNGSTGGLRGRKRSLFEGGIRVPGLLEWPAKVRKHRVIDMPCGTEDYFPTVLAALGIEDKATVRPIDGVNLMPLIEGRMTQRPRPLGRQSRGQIALIDNRYKIIQLPSDPKSSKRGGTGGKPSGSKTGWMLFDLVKDPHETKDIASEKPE
ncbi:MAG: sulfatase-like hydrolase/transferase, partial [Planctomycetes bacterium]|nr:sulfatase-like hydrolase/transferase [Planctomycetota bacterium]